MPNIIVKNEYGEDEVYNDVNTVKFLDESGNVVSYKYNTGEIYPRPTGNRVRFIDHDGFVLSTIYVDTGDTVYYPEINPTREGFTFIGWNWSLEDLANISQDVDVGAMYAPNSLENPEQISNATTIRIRLPLTERNFSFYIYSDGANTFLVDWGDGNTNTYTATGSGRIQMAHNSVYDYGGEYTITLIRISGDAEYWLGYNNKTGTSSSSTFNLYGIVKHIFLSNEISFIPFQAFNGQYCMEIISTPNIITEIGNGYIFNSCYSLESFIYPKALTSMGNSMFSSCYNLRTVILPNGLTSIGNQTFYNCASLRHIVIPDGVTSIGQSAFQSCSSIKSVVIPDSVTTIGNSSFLSCYSLQDVYIYATTPPTLGPSNFSNSINSRRIHVPAGTEAAYKAATNWSALANYIVGDL